MRKIDERTHLRFINAVENLIKDLDSFGHPDMADELVISRDELEHIYHSYSRKIAEVNELIRIYQELFDKKHVEYLHASRLRQKENTRAKHKEKKLSEISWRNGE